MKERIVPIGTDGHRTDVFRNEKGQVECNAKKRNKSDRCKGRPILGSLRCRVHGGKSLRGPASPQYKHGRNSKWLATLGITPPDDRDGSMLDVRNGVLIQQKVIERVHARMEENDSPAFRATCVKRFKALKDALYAKDPELIQSSLRSLEGWLIRGKREDDSLKQLSDSAYKLSSQIEGAHRARTNSVNSMNKNDALAFMTDIVRLVREEVGVDAASRVFSRANRELLAGRVEGCIAGDDVEAEPRDVEDLAD